MYTYHNSKTTLETGIIQTVIRKHGPKGEDGSVPAILVTVDIAFNNHSIQDYYSYAF